MLDVDSLLNDYFQNKEEDKSKFLMKAASSVLKKLLHQDEINHFIETNQYLEGLEFNDAVLDHFNFSFQVSNKDRFDMNQNQSIDAVGEVWIHVKA